MTRRLSGLAASLLLLALLTTVLVTPGAAEAGPSGDRQARSAGAAFESRVIGRTVKGRPIRAWHLGDPASPVKAVFIGTIHGNEASPARILEDLRDGAPVTGADIWVVPYLNRDGYVRHTRKNAHGVDLNRNFPVSWIRQHGTYNSGPRPASERETRVIMRFLKAVRPSYVVSFHQPLFGIDDSYAKGHVFAGILSQDLGLPIKVFTCNHRCHGTLTQWFNKRLPGVALTVEYGARMTWAQKHVTGPAGLLASVGAAR
ncbi:murein peptide amidase A [Marmoricola sp. URHA0025 HA25]